MPVVATDKLHHQSPSGESARQANGAHGRFGAGIDQAHLFHRRKSLVDELRQADLGLRGEPVGRSPLQRLLDRTLNIGVGVAQQKRPPSPDVIDKVLPVGVGDLGAPGAGGEQRGAAHGAKRPDRRIHPAGDQFLGALVKFLRSRSLWD